MRTTISSNDVQALKEQLSRIRQQSLAASRKNDFRTIARLTSEAARLNRAIHLQQDFADSPVKALAIVDALAHFDDEGHFVFPDEPVIAGVPRQIAPVLDEAA